LLKKKGMFDGSDKDGFKESHTKGGKKKGQEADNLLAAKGRLSKLNELRGKLGKRGGKKGKGTSRGKHFPKNKANLLTNPSRQRKEARVLKRGRRGRTPKNLPSFAKKKRSQVECLSRKG